MSTPGLTPTGQLLPPSKPYVDWPGAIAAGAATAAGSWWVAGWVFHHDLTYLGMGTADAETYGATVKYLLKSAINAAAPRLFIADTQAYAAHVAQFDAFHNSLFPSLASRHWLSATAGIIAGAYVGWLAATPRSAEITIDGGDLVEAKHSKKAGKRLSAGADGIEIAPRLRITKERESKHFFIVGGTGSGKSVMIWNIALQAFQRGDRQVIFNFKGFIEKWPARLRADGKKQIDAVIIAPWDSRSVVWLIALDVRTLSEARDFAARLIVEGKDPMWSNSARAVLTGCIVALQKMRPRKWTWQQLSEMTTLPRDKLAEIVAEHFPEGLRSIEHFGKTADGVLINLAAYLVVVHDLARAWPGDYEPNRGISFRRFICDPDCKNRTLIVGISGQFKQLTDGMAPAIIGIMSAQLSALPDVSADKNRLFIVADEFPRLGKITDFGQFLDVGRSKGVRAVIAAQTIPQLIDIYGENLVKSWTDLVGTRIFGSSAGSTAEWISKHVGKRNVERLSVSVSSGQGSSSSRSYQRDKIDHIVPGDVEKKLGLLSDLGVGKNGVRMLIAGIGDPRIVDIPFRDLPDRRPGTILADWAKAPGDDETENGDAAAFGNTPAPSAVKKAIEPEHKFEQQVDAHQQQAQEFDISELGEPLDKLAEEGMIEHIAGPASALINVAEIINETASKAGAPATTHQQRRELETENEFDF